MLRTRASISSLVLLGSLVPERDVANFAVNARLYKEMKLKGFVSEGRKALMITWLSYYMRGKLMWDANADVEAIKIDFYTKFFGPEAGPRVRELTLDWMRTKLSPAGGPATGAARR